MGTKTTKIRTATAEQTANWSAASPNVAFFFGTTIPGWTDEHLALQLGCYFPGLPGNATTRTRRNHAVMVAEATRRGWTAEQIEMASLATLNKAAGHSL